MLGTNGLPIKAKRAGQPLDLVKPGEVSEWLDIGPCLNTESASPMTILAEMVDQKGEALSASNQPAFIPFSIDIALEPNEKKIIKSFSSGVKGIGREITFLLQPDLNTEEGRQWTMALLDVYDLVSTELAKEPRTAHIPKRMKFFGTTGSPFYSDKNLRNVTFDNAMRYRFEIGLNTVFGDYFELKREDYLKQADWYSKRGASLVLKSAVFHHSTDAEKMANKIMTNGVPEYFYYLSYGDEIGLPAISIKDDVALNKFREHLKAQGLQPKDFGLGDWDAVKPLASFSADVAVKIGVLDESKKDSAELDPALKRLYWHSHTYRIEKGIEDFAQKTKRFRELLGKDVHTTANLGGMHPFYWMHQGSFIQSFRHNAMTIAWSEDYDFLSPETSRLVIEFQAGYLKAGTMKHKQRMMFYCMPHYFGNSPEHLIHNFISEIGQNVKDIDWFMITPDGFSTENYVNPREGLDMFKAMRLASDMAGAVEDWLEEAQPVRARVGLLLSEASDVWELRGRSQNDVRPGSEPTNAFQEERKNTYYILRNAGYRVDLLTEDDLIEGNLKGYRALYVCGENIQRKAANALVEWVKAGGVLYCSAGAARKDEYDEPINLINDVVGRGKQKEYNRYRGPLRGNLELLFLKSLGEVKLEDGSVFPALATLEKFDVGSGANVFAKLNGAEAIGVNKKLGNGMGWYIGTFPGQAWAKKGLPVMPCGRGGPESTIRYPQFEPTDFDMSAANCVLLPLKKVGLEADFIIDKPNIVCNRLEGNKAVVLTVINLGATRKGAVKDVNIACADINGAKKVWSYYHRKGLVGEAKDNRFNIKLPELGLVDIIVIEK